MAPPPRSRLALALLGALLAAPDARAQTAFPPDESRTLGRPVTDAALVDEQGRTFRVASLAGKPLVVSPIFTKCPHVCPMITTSLKQALAEVGTAGEDFHVLTVTFDASDTQADLAAYKQRRGLPAAWRVARASREELLPFLESLDFRFLSHADGSFTHPNLVVFLSPELAVAKYLYGTEYTAGDVRSALAIARGGRSLGQRFGPYLFLVGVLGALAAAFVLLVALQRSRR